MQVTISISGLDEKLEQLDRLDQQFVLFKDAFEAIGKELIDYFSGQVFASQGGVLDANWDPLSAEYAAWKAVNYPGAPPLVRSGEMQDSFYYDANETSLTIGNSSDHFVYHQSSETREKIPRRVMLAVNEDIKGVISYILEQDVNKKITEAGL